MIHTISRPGETLIALARWYTGDSRNWEAIAEANPGLTPTRIHVGDTVKILGNLLITRKQLPRSNPTVGHRVKRSLPRRPKPINAELFGPIVTLYSTQETGRDDLPVPLETLE